MFSKYYVMRRYTLGNYIRLIVVAIVAAGGLFTSHRFSLVSASQLLFQMQSVRRPNEIAVSKLVTGAQV